MNDITKNVNDKIVDSISMKEDISKTMTTLDYLAKSCFSYSYKNINGVVFDDLKGSSRTFKGKDKSYVTMGKCKNRISQLYSFCVDMSKLVVEESSKILDDIIYIETHIAENSKSYNLKTEKQIVDEYCNLSLEMAIMALKRGDGFFTKEIIEDFIVKFKERLNRVYYYKKNDKGFNSFKSDVVQEFKLSMGEFNHLSSRITNILKKFAGKNMKSDVLRDIKEIYEVIDSFDYHLTEILIQSNTYNYAIASVLPDYYSLSETLDFINDNIINEQLLDSFSLLLIWQKDVLYKYVHIDLRGISIYTINQKNKVERKLLSTLLNLKHFKREEV